MFFCSFLVYSLTYLLDAIFLWVLSSKIGYIITSIFRQEDSDVEHGSSDPDISEKLARLSTDDTSLTDWHLGFHIFLVSLNSLFLCLCSTLAEQSTLKSCFYYFCSILFAYTALGFIFLTHLLFQCISAGYAA